MRVAFQPVGDLEDERRSTMPGRSTMPDLREGEIDSGAFLRKIQRL